MIPSRHTTVVASRNNKPIRYRLPISGASAHFDTDVTTPDRPDRIRYLVVLHCENGDVPAYSCGKLAGALHRARLMREDREVPAYIQTRWPAPLGKLLQVRIVLMLNNTYYASGTLEKPPRRDESLLFEVPNAQHHT